MTKHRPTWKLREWRKYLNRTQEWLANETGLHKGDISALETGAQRWNESHLTKFARALGVPRWWLVDIDPNDPANEATLLQAIHALPREKRSDLTRIIDALGDRRRASGED